MVRVLVILAAASVGTAIPGSDVMANIRMGRMLCSNPNSAARTCSAIAKFEPESDGRIIETTEVLISKRPAMTLELSAVGQVRGSEICGIVELADLQKGRVRLDGEILSPDRNAAILATLVDRLSPRAGHRACETVRSNRGGLEKAGKLEGTRIVLQPRPVKWISPDEGYRVSPSSAD